MIENIHTIVGTLYAKNHIKKPNLKKPTEPDWEFYYIKVECKINISGREITQIPELMLDKGLSYDGFEVGDKIEVDFYLSGKQINPTWFKTEPKALFIKFAPLENGEIRTPHKTQDTTFINPNPTEINDDSSDDPLPF